MIATYVVVKLRMFTFPPEKWTPFDHKFLAGATIVCFVCWFVVAFQALKTAFG